jgi:hypothetical protein
MDSFQENYLPENSSLVVRCLSQFDICSLHILTSSANDEREQKEDLVKVDNEEEKPGNTQTSLQDLVLASNNTSDSSNMTAGGCDPACLSQGRCEVGPDGYCGCSKGWNGQIKCLIHGCPNECGEDQGQGICLQVSSVQY